MTVLGLSPGELYEALRTRDQRFDGRVFVGVSSTRIYCRLVCTVRPPQQKNCTFYQTAAHAEAAGFRPCLRCRPELAPGSGAPVDAVPRLAGLALRRIEDGALSSINLEELAAELRVTARHLRRALQQETGLSPIRLAQTQRLLLAKQLLTDTRMSITEVAFSAGFGSLRRFNTAFRSHYRLTPTAVRMSGRKVRIAEDAYHFPLSVRPPFDLQPLFQFWEARATPGVEQVIDGEYRRVVQVQGHTGWIAIGPAHDAQTVAVQISTSLGPVLATVLARLKNMLDVRAEPTAIADCLGDDPLLAPLLARMPGPRLPGAFEGFECGIRAILGQQISVKGATTLAGRLAHRFGQQQQDIGDSLDRSFPTPEALAAATLPDLQRIGLTNRRAETIQGFATAVAEGRIHLEPGVDPDRLRAELVALPGIGEWTAEYLLIRAIGWPDAFPASDLGLLRASGLTVRELTARAERWRPWRSYAAMLLWQSTVNRESETSELERDRASLPPQQAVARTKTRRRHPANS